jgi:hypothetical protein
MESKPFTDAQLINKFIRVLDAYRGGTALVSNQGQSLDGYSALAEFVAIAALAKEQRDAESTPSVSSSPPDH